MSLLLLLRSLATVPILVSGHGVSPRGPRDAAPLGTHARGPRDAAPVLAGVLPLAVYGGERTAGTYTTSPTLPGTRGPRSAAPVTAFARGPRDAPGPVVAPNAAAVFRLPLLLPVVGATARPAQPVGDTVPAQAPAQAQQTPSVVTWIGAFFPDRVDGAYVTAAAQFAATSLSPYPEQTIALAWAPSFPDRPTVVFEHASQALAFATSALPLATVVVPTQPLTWYPDGVVRPSLLVSQQLASAALGPAPERTVPIASVSWPDRFDSPPFAASARWSHSQSSPRPENTVSLDWQPEDIERKPGGDNAWSVVYGIHHVFPDFGPDDDLSVTQGYVWYPDALPALGVHVSRQLDALAEPQQLLTAWVDALFQDSVARPFLAVSEQFASTELSPNPERTSTLSAVWHPDSIARPTYGSFEQLAHTLPAPTVVAWIDAVYPDAVLRPYLAVAEQQAQAWPAPTVLAWVDALYVDRVDRPTFQASQQLATAQQPSYAATFQLVLNWQPAYPDRPIPVWLSVTEQQAFALPAPLVLAWVDSIAPDRVDRPTFATWQQPAFFGGATVPIPNPPPSTTFPWIRTFSLGIRLGM